MALAETPAEMTEEKMANVDNDARVAEADNVDNVEDGGPVEETQVEEVRTDAPKLSASDGTTSLGPDDVHQDAAKTSPSATEDPTQADEQHETVEEECKTTGSKDETSATGDDRPTVSNTIEEETAASSDVSTSKPAETNTVQESLSSDVKVKSEPENGNGSSISQGQPSENSSAGGVKDILAAKRQQKRSLSEALTKRGIPEKMSSATYPDPKLRPGFSNDHSRSSKRLRLGKEVPAGDSGDQDGWSSSEGEFGMVGMMEYDGWASPDEDDETKWAEKWSEGLSASDDDSDGEGDECFRPTDSSTEEGAVLRRKNHLEKLRRLYHLQYFRLKRLLEKRYATYVTERDKAAPAVVSTVAAKIPVNKRKLAEGGPPHFDDDDEDSSATHQHRYNRRSGINAALWLQKWQRLETGYSYPHAIGTASAHSTSRFRCSFQQSNAAPCYNCSLPMSKYCLTHIMKDQLQMPYKLCQYTDGTYHCQRPILKPTVPSFCDMHIELSEITRNPRLSGAPPALVAQDGMMPNLEADLQFGSAAPLDLDDLEALVGEVTQTPQMSLAEFDGLSNIMGQLQEDETKTVAALQRSLTETTAAAVTTTESTATVAPLAAEAASGDGV